MKSSEIPDVDVTVKLNNGNVLVELSKTTDLMFSEIFNTKLSKLFADSEVPLPGSSNGGNGGNNYNVALVLDAAAHFTRSCNFGPLQCSQVAGNHRTVLGKALSNC